MKKTEGQGRLQLNDEVVKVDYMPTVYCRIRFAPKRQVVLFEKMLRKKAVYLSLIGVR